MQIPRISQVPIQQPIYVNGVMHPVWVRFFEQLADLQNSNDIADLLELTQLVHQLPSQATLGQQGQAIAALEHMLNPIHISIPNPEQLPAIPICIPQQDYLPSVQAVFLTQNNAMDYVALPSQEVIK